MKKKMKRILAALITFVMILGSLPIYAAGGNTERTEKMKMRRSI